MTGKNKTTILSLPKKYVKDLVQPASLDHPEGADFINNEKTGPVHLSEYLPNDTSPKIIQTFKETVDFDYQT